MQVYHLITCLRNIGESSANSYTSVNWFISVSVQYWSLQRGIVTFMGVYSSIEICYMANISKDGFHLFQRSVWFFPIAIDSEIAGDLWATFLKFQNTTQISIQSNRKLCTGSLSTYILFDSASKS